VGENGIHAAFVGCSMCNIAPGGIPGIAIRPGGVIAAAELTAIVAPTTTTISALLNLRPPESGILAPLLNLRPPEFGILAP
jgi:hypothetical protein